MGMTRDKEWETNRFEELLVDAMVFYGDDFPNPKHHPKQAAFHVWMFKYFHPEKISNNYPVQKPD